MSLCTELVHDIIYHQVKAPLFLVAQDLTLFCICVNVQSQPASLAAEDISTNSNGPKQDSLFDDDPEDLFAGRNPQTHFHIKIKLQWLQRDGQKSMQKGPHCSPSVTSIKLFPMSFWWAGFPSCWIQNDIHLVNYGSIRVKTDESLEVWSLNHTESQWLPVVSLWCYRSDRGGFVGQSRERRSAVRWPIARHHPHHPSHVRHHPSHWPHPRRHVHTLLIWWGNGTQNWLLILW